MCSFYIKVHTICTAEKNRNIFIFIFESANYSSRIDKMRNFFMFVCLCKRGSDRQIEADIHRERDRVRESERQRETERERERDRDRERDRKRDRKRQRHRQ